MRVLLVLTFTRSSIGPSIPLVTETLSHGYTGGVVCVCIVSTYIHKVLHWALYTPRHRDTGSWLHWRCRLCGYGRDKYCRHPRWNQVCRCSMDKLWDRQHQLSNHNVMDIGLSCGLRPSLSHQNNIWWIIPYLKYPFHPSQRKHQSSTLLILSGGNSPGTSGFL